MTAQSSQNNKAFTDSVSDAKAHAVRLTLWPLRWKKFQLIHRLNWRVFEFNSAVISRIPNRPGVYTFLIQPRLASNLDTSYLMYVGKTDRSLQQRYREYLKEVNDDSGRPKIVEMLNRYSGYVYFSCASVTAKSATPAQIEDELLKAFMPPTNEKYPAEVRRIVAAF